MRNLHDLGRERNQGENMLRIGRIKESVYQRSVEKQLHNDKKAGQPYLTQTVTVEGWTLAAERVVRNMVNAFASRGAAVEQITVSVIMPAGSEEAAFRGFTSGLGYLCKQEKIWVTVEDARVLREVSIPLIRAVGIGPQTGKTETDRLAADIDVILAGSIAREGAAILAIEKEEELRKRFAAFYVEAAQALYDDAAMPAVRELIREYGAHGIAVREGGIFAGLWNLAAAGKVGLDIDLGAIPIRQHTVEVCEYFNLNPYMLLSGGCILLAAAHGESLVAALEDRGITAAVIGKTRNGNDRIIRYDDEIRYLEPPKADEIYAARDAQASYEKER